MATTSVVSQEPLFWRQTIALNGKLCFYVQRAKPCRILISAPLCASFTETHSQQKRAQNPSICQVNDPTNASRNTNISVVNKRISATLIPLL